MNEQKQIVYEVVVGGVFLLQSPGKDAGES